MHQNFVFTCCCLCRLALCVCVFLFVRVHYMNQGYFHIGGEYQKAIFQATSKEVKEAFYRLSKVGYLIFIRYAASLCMADLVLHSLSLVLPLWPVLPAAWVASAGLLDLNANILRYFSYFIIINIINS